MIRSKVNIILVDDNDIDLAVNTKLLQFSDFAGNIEIFNSAQQFLDEIQRRHFDEPVVLLLDIMMPGINGFECLEKFSELPESITSQFLVFMLSSSIDRNDIRRAESFPVVIKVLEKPLDVFLLKRHLANALAG